VGTLRQRLRPQLPAYMVPAAFVALPALPRNKSGKLDRFALPIPGSGRPDLGHAFEPPVGPVETAVAAAFAHVLGVEPVGRHDDFGDLGGDSLGAAEAMTLMAAALGRDLPLSIFLEASTPAELARRFDEPHSNAPERFVVLQPDGDGPPVYCLHGGGGQVLSYATLAERLGTSQPFVGVQMRSRDRARRLFRVRSLAKRYARLIAERQQGRPCVVAGHSYGGLLAHEVARQLTDRGETVERCILLDAGLRPNGTLLDRVPMASTVTGSGRRLLQRKNLGYAVHAMAGLRPRPHRVTTERMVAAQWGITWHRPRRSGVPLVVVRATDLPGDRGMARWADLTDASCVVTELPGDHDSVLATPHVDELAAAIRAQLA
jgi:thioesterase domain-containing protein